MAGTNANVNANANASANPQQQQQGQQAPQGQQPAPQGSGAAIVPGVQAIQALGGATPPLEQTIGVIEKFPADRDEIIAFLHKTAGNAYVSQVMNAQGNPQQSTLGKVGTTMGDSAWLAVEIGKMLLINPFTGIASGTVDAAGLIRLLQLVAPSLIPAITLGAQPKGANQVHVKCELYNGRALTIDAPLLQIGGYTDDTFSAGQAQLTNVHGTYKGGAIEASFAHAQFQHVIFYKGGDHLIAREVVADNLDASKGTSSAAMKFSHAHVHGLQYPNMPAVDLDINGGVSFAAVWAQQPAGAAPAAAAAPTGLPSAGMANPLPKGATVKIALVAGDAAADLQGEKGGGSFQSFSAAIVLDGKNLASLEIDGFSGGGGKDSAGASIKMFKVTGEAALVSSLLANPQIAGNAAVKHALDVVKGAGVNPAVGGTVIVSDLKAGHNAAADSASANVAVEVDVPQLGKLAMTITGLVGKAGTATGAEGGFEHLTMALTSPTGDRLASLTLGGADGKKDAKGVAGEIKQLQAEGDVAKLVEAADAVVKTQSPQIQGALKAVKALGIKGDIKGDIKVSAGAAKDAKMTVVGDFDVDVEADGAIVKLAIKGMESDADGTMKLGSFTATLASGKGKGNAASIALKGAVSTPAKPGHDASTKVGSIVATGEDEAVAAMLGHIQKKAGTLPPAVASAFAMVTKFHASAGGTISLANVTETKDKKGVEHVTASDVHGKFELHQAGHADVVLTGFKGANAAAGSSLSFTKFTAALTDTTGKQAAALTISGTKDASVEKNGDFKLNADALSISGDAQAAKQLLGGIKAHLKSLPQPIAAAFQLAEQYIGDLAASGSIDVTSAAVASKAGKVSGRGNLTADVKLPKGELTATLLDAETDGDNVKFTELQLAVKDAQGGAPAIATAKNLNAALAGTSAKLGSLSIHGDAKKLKDVLDPATIARLPPAFAQVLPMIDRSQLDVDVDVKDVSVDKGADGVVTAGVKALAATADVDFTDEAGHKYTAKKAHFELSGGKLETDKAGKPHEVTAQGMLVSGKFSSSGAGADALSGEGSVRTGSAVILLDGAGKPTAVSASNIRVEGAAKRAVAPGHAAAPAPAPSKDAKLAALDGQAKMGQEVAGAVQQGNIDATIPLFAGSYGRGAASAEVAVGTTISIGIEIRNNALTNKTAVKIQPELDLLGPLGGKGVYLETKGAEGVLKADIDWFPDLNISKYLTGEKKLQLDLPKLVAAVTGHMRAGILAETPKSARDEMRDAEQAQDKANEDAAWLADKKEDWQKDHDKLAAKGARASQKDKDKDAKKQPRSANIADLATPGVGVNLPGVVADAHMNLRSTDGKIAGNLSGHATGNGVMRMISDEMKADVGGNKIDAKGVDTGNIVVDPNLSSVALTGLTIGSLTWAK